MDGKQGRLLHDSSPAPVQDYGVSDTYLA